MAIVGGGFAGFALACRLAEQERSFVLLERRVDQPPRNRAIFLQPNGLAAAARLGILDRVRAVGATTRTVRCCDQRGRQFLTYSYGDLRHPHPYSLGIRYCDLHACPTGRVEALGGERPVTGAECTGLVMSGGQVAGVRFREAGGAERAVLAALVVGADGAGSCVRSSLDTRARRARVEGRFVIGLSERCGLERDGEAIYYGRGYGDGVFPVGAGATHFWDRVDGSNREAVDRQDLEAWLTGYGRRVPVASRLATGLSSWSDLCVLGARAWKAGWRVAEGAALVGDAAGTVHPMAGQGADLALEDALALGDVLVRLGRPLSRVRAAELASFGRARDRRLAHYVAWSRLAALSIDAPGAPWRAVRRAGFVAARVRAVHRRMLAPTAGVGWT